jgi:hypothetical protein
MRSVVSILFLYLFLLPALANDNPVYQYISETDISSLAKYLEEHDINSVLEDSNTTLLVYAINHKNPRICNYLIDQGADVNQYIRGRSPLMHASMGMSVRIVRLLVKASAEILALDSINNTALFYAAAGGSEKICKVLLKNEIPLNHQNFFRKTAYDYAILNGQRESASFLRKYHERYLPDMQDGPYIKWGTFNRIRAFYISHDSIKRLTQKNTMKFRAKTDPFLIEGFSGDSLDYLLFKSKEVPNDQISVSEKILVLGDVHGGYDSLINFLIGNGITDHNLNWTWDQGHLVFLGDIFDRGDKVTEALWLIYRLEGQASVAGGMVHFLLGNHEVMILRKNQQYIADKYRLLSDRVSLDYSSLYGKHWVLGNWLRTRNTIMKINEHLFVHAGLSPKLTSSGLSMSDINNMIRYFLNHPERAHHDNYSRSFFLGPDGPFWYRGFMEGNHEYDHLQESELDKIMAYFDAKTIFVGHTNVDHITPHYNSRVYALDVPYYHLDHSMEALLIEGKDFFVLKSNSEKIRISN